MKTFKDLQFLPHPNLSGVQAKLFFPNGYGVSIVRLKSPSCGFASYTNNDQEWELAVLFGNEDNWSLTYNTPISDDVIGHLSDTDVTNIMKQVQELPA
jgi:hypothetical protein